MTGGGLPAILIEPVVRAALVEDLGRAGDITTDAVVPPDARLACAIVARQPGIVAGIEVARLAFRLLDPTLGIAVQAPDGAAVTPGQPVLRIDGAARAILTGERTALNFLCHLSGVASATQGLVQAVEGTRARIICTRKTTPGLRALEKYAVRTGGGVSHRFGLDDGILIKDNHIAVAGGAAAAIRRARRAAGHMVKIEVEVDRLDQLDEVLREGVDAVLLDNMDPDTLARAVARVEGCAVTEASGRVTLNSVRAIAESGVDLISAGWITHSAPALDFGLDAEGV
jgi:nicotinate-nucleotide pyrophosphorylase (carboxylating)